MKICYSLQPILLFANPDVSTKMCLDTSTLAKSIMGRREYILFFKFLGEKYKLDQNKI
jgi:hypothetical protein